MHDIGRIDRRQVIAGLAAIGSLAAAPSHAALQQAVQAPSALIVAGPPGGHLDHWATVLTAAVGRASPGRAWLQRQNIGGQDGVTGANQFEARSEPDGSTALLVPGLAALSWLVGETRAKFDPGRWVPLWAGAGSAVLVSRAALLLGRPLRVAAAGPVGAELPALLALDLMGITAVLVEPGSAEAMIVQGPDLRASLTTAASSGFEPVMTLGAIGADGQIVRDPILPTVMTAFELAGTQQASSLGTALRAASVAVQLDAGLVLPQLTPAGSVALWRRACLPLMQDPDVLAEAARMGIRVVPAAATAAYVGRIAGDVGSLLALRQWLAVRHDWQPS